MPVYAYKCSKCDSSVLEERSIHEPDVAPTCNLCGSPTRRIYQLAGVTFNGSGWGRDNPPPKKR